MIYDSEMDDVQKHEVDDLQKQNALCCEMDDVEETKCCMLCWAVLRFWRINCNS